MLQRYYIYACKYVRIYTKRCKIVHSLGDELFLGRPQSRAGGFDRYFACAGCGAEDG